MVTLTIKPGQLIPVCSKNLLVMDVGFFLRTISPEELEVTRLDVKIGGAFSCGEKFSGTVLICESCARPLGIVW